MQALNLLGPNEKQDTKLIKTFFVVRYVSFISLSAIIIFSLTLFIAEYVSSDYLKSLNNQIQGELVLRQEGKINSIEEATTELNSQLNAINSIQSKYIKWTQLLSTISSSMPPGIKISNMQTNSNLRTFNLTGIAGKRDDLTIMFNNLNNLGIFEQLKPPSTNLIQKENISFELAGQFNEKIYE